MKCHVRQDTNCEVKRDRLRSLTVVKCDPSSGGMARAEPLLVQGDSSFVLQILFCRASDS
jgi:hypothetical protein